MTSLRNLVAKADFYCPCCGSPVTIYTGREGTSSYEPLATEFLAVAEAAEHIYDVAANWVRQNDAFVALDAALASLRTRLDS